MKILLVGQSGGIGSGIYDLLKQRDADVVCLNRDACDLSKTISIDYSGIDGLVYSAGINSPTAYNDLHIDNLVETMKINAISFVELCQKVRFNIGANIVAIGSLYSTETKAGRLAYTMSKHALLGAVKTLAIEMASNKIKVNMLSPGFVYTKLTTKNNSPERLAYLKNNIPLGMTSIDDIAETCYFLLKTNSVTGQNLIVDNGYSLLGI